MDYKVFRTSTFEKEFKKLSRALQEEVHKFEKEISTNPKSGRPLGFTYFREKRLNGKRIYFLVY